MSDIESEILRTLPATAFFDSVNHSPSGREYDHYLDSSDNPFTSFTVYVDEAQDALMILNHPDPDNMVASDFNVSRRQGGSATGSVAFTEYPLFHLEKAQGHSFNFVDFEVKNICFLADHTTGDPEIFLVVHKFANQP